VTKWLAGREVDAYGTNRQRLTEIAERNPGYRLLPDNFYGVEQSVIVAKGNKPLLDAVNIALARGAALRPHRRGDRAFRADRPRCRAGKAMMRRLSSSTGSPD
jgi:hypothetical protein